MMRLLLSVLVASSVFSGTYGLASRFGTRSDLGGTSVGVSACQEAELHLGFSPVSSSSTTGSPWGTDVRVSGIEPHTCARARIEVVLLGGTSVLAKATSVLGNTGPSQTFRFPGVDPAIITGASVTIAG